MLRIARLLSMFVLALAGSASMRAMAQSPEPAPAYEAPRGPQGIPGETPGDTDPLPRLPRPPDVPASLFQPAPPTASFSGDPLPGPYFDCDPRLDPPPLPHPGWLFDVEVGIDLPRVRNEISAPVTLNGVTRTVILPSATLDWTAAPRFNLGYRLPDGFGEFALTYRFLVSEGSSTVPGPDALASLRSRLDINMADLDYASNEMTVWDCWAWKWRIGLRGADIFLDSRANEPTAAAAGGSTIFESAVSNNFWGIGPHASLEMERRISDWGLSLVGKIDAAILLGRVDQSFFESSTVTGLGGHHLSTDFTQSNPGSVPMVNLSLGAAWKPAACPGLRVFLGYEFEYWWNVGRFQNSEADDAEVSDQGVLLRADFNY